MSSVVAAVIAVAVAVAVAAAAAAAAAGAGDPRCFHVFCSKGYFALVFSAMLLRLLERILHVRPAHGSMTESIASSV